MSLDLDAIEALIASYRARHSHEGSFDCCSAHAVADETPALIARVRELEAQRDALAAEVNRGRHEFVLTRSLDTWGGHSQPGDWCGEPDGSTTRQRPAGCPKNECARSPEHPIHRTAARVLAEAHDTEEARG